MKYIPIICCAMMLACMARGAELPLMEAARFDTKPVLDGKLDDLAWRQAKSYGNFFILEGKGEQATNTEVRLGHDDAWLYVGINCRNPQMKILGPIISGHDRGACQDDSIEIFLDPGAKGKMYFHYMLGFAGARDEARVVVGEKKEVAWEFPWLSAVNVTGAGWSAEIALPLFFIASCGPIGDIRLNFARNLRIPVFDPCGVHVDNKYERSTWSPVAKSFNESRRFGGVTGLAVEKIETPPLASLNNIEIGPYALKEGRSCYNIACTLQDRSGRTGDYEIVVKDVPVTGPANEIVRNISVAPGLQQDVLVSVPTETMCARSVGVSLNNSAGELLQSVVIDSPPELQVMSVYLDRSYYTTESNCVAVCSFRLPEAALNGMDLAIKDTNGNVLCAATMLAAETQIDVPIEKLPAGAHGIIVELRDKNSKAVFVGTRETLVKKTPNPGCEWKVDRANRVVLNNGRPFFPIGFIETGLTSKNDWLFDLVKDLGFNTAPFWTTNPKPELDEANAYQEAAARRNLYTIAYPEAFAPEVEMKTYAQYLPPDAVKRLNKYNYRSLASLKSEFSANAGMRNLSKQQKNAIFGELYEKTINVMIQSVERVKRYDNMIGFFIFDEPHGPRLFDQYMFGRDFYGRIHRADGYHPVMVNFSGVPEYDENLYGWYDIQINDPYLMPPFIGRTGRSAMTYVAAETAKADLNTSYRRQVTWVILLADIFGTGKRSLTPGEQVCQTYLALISGAKGLFYHPLPRGEVMRNCFRELFLKQLPLITPAVMAPGVKQTVSYRRETLETNGTVKVLDVACNPSENEFPEVMIRLFKDERGYIMLAANVSRFPLDIACRVQGATQRVVSMVDGRACEVHDQTFSDRLEGFGTRAFRIQRAPNAVEPVAVDVVTRECRESLPGPESVHAFNWRNGSKNEFPNPSLEIATVQGWPDYYRFYTGNYIYKYGVGSSNAEWGITSEHPYHGAYCLKMAANPGNLHNTFVYCAPQNDRPVPYTFSVYLRGTRDAMKVWLRAQGLEGGPGEHIQVGSEWKRYWISGTLPAGAPKYSLFSVFLLEKEGAIWADAFQLEKGSVPSPFED